MNKHDYALKLVSRDEQHRPALGEIVKQEEYYYACSNGFAVMRTKNKSTISKNREELQCCPNYTDIFNDFIETDKKIINVENLYSLYTAANIKAAYPKKTCLKCIGDGCEECDQTGLSTDDKEFAKLKIKGSDIYFDDYLINPNILNLIILVSSIYKIDQLQVKYCTDIKRIMICCNDFDFLILTRKKEIENDL